MDFSYRTLICRLVRLSVRIISLVESANVLKIRLACDLLKQFFVLSLHFFILIHEIFILSLQLLILIIKSIKFILKFQQSLLEDVGIIRMEVILLNFGLRLALRRALVVQLPLNRFNAGRALSSRRMHLNYFYLICYPLWSFKIVCYFRHFQALLAFLFNDVYFFFFSPLIGILLLLKVVVTDLLV